MVKGAGLQNGGPYHCVKEWWYFERCTWGKPPDGDAWFGNDPPKVEDSLEYAKKMKKEKKIDDLENLNGQPVYVLRGLQDPVVTSANIQAEFYKNLFTKLTYVEKDWGHMLRIKADSSVAPVQSSCQSDFGGNVNCDFDSTKEIIENVLMKVPGTKIKDLKEPIVDWKSKGTLHKFQQGQFIDELWTVSTGLHKHGFAYVPRTCNKDCMLHVSFHGCNQSIGWDESDFRYIL